MTFLEHAYFDTHRRIDLGHSGGVGGISMMQQSMTTVWQRMIGAAKLDPNAYEAVERDVNANSSALMIVILAALASGIGALTSNGFRALIVAVIADLISWVLYAAVAYVIGTRIFQTAETRATLGELLRTLGYAQTPNLLLIFAGIPVFGVIVSVVVFFWFLATTVVALRQALDFTTGRAIGTAVVSWFLFIIPYLVIVALIS
jgi:hypothetical protein